ncbi:MAG: ATP-dependent DNA helicase RecG [Bacteroidota bacterium]
MAVDLLDTSIEYLKGVGPQRGDVLKKELGIFTYRDLLFYFPYRYIDRSKFYNISEINADLAYIQVKGVIVNAKLMGDGRSKRYIATLKDSSGDFIELVWFNSIKWVSNFIILNQEYIVFGHPTLFNGRYSFNHPDIEIPATVPQNLVSKSFMPLYNTTEKARVKGLDNKSIGKLVFSLLPQIKGFIPEIFPNDFISQEKMIGRESALFNIHFPESLHDLAEAEYRLKFEELFFNQLRLIFLKLIRTSKYQGFVFSKIGTNFLTFFNDFLPFELTGAQKRVIKEIRTDFQLGKQMNRLLQGDVGSGKTLVALMSMLIATDNGFQACLMAPTEILAQQHFKSISKFLDNQNVTVELLTGSTKKSLRHTIHAGLLDGSIHLLIGTHALLEDIVQFKNLGLVVIDEQHRFGVAQRAKLWTKNEIHPHILVMTATPIPRTLAMTLYGDLDVSVIDELPPGRKSIITAHYYDSQRLRINGFIKKQIELGRQIYVVYPLISESEKLDLKHLEDGYESLSREFPLPKYAISVVHGKMKPADKNREMQRFVRGETQIMVATTVIEVGVDVPNASVMIVEDAHRFGLSQLHQLRGRVGRGADQSFCILVTNFKLTMDGKKRLEAMVKTSDGFEIANLDLKLRGPGDIEGTRQSGALDFKIADIVKDEKILINARNSAIEMLEKDPKLKENQHRIIAEHLALILKKNGNWGLIS